MVLVVLLSVNLSVVVLLKHANNNGEWRYSKRGEDSLSEPAEIGCMLNKSRALAGCTDGQRQPELQRQLKN